MANDTSIIVIDGTEYTLVDANAKRLQTAVSGPSSTSGSATTFVDSISQNEEGVITYTTKQISSEIPGTAEYAEELSNAKAIDGIIFSNNHNITHFFRTTTTSGTVQLLSDSLPTTLVDRTLIAVHFTDNYLDTTNHLKIALSVGIGTAYPALYKGANIDGVPANTIMFFALDKTDANNICWRQIGDTNTDTTYVFDGTYSPTDNKAATVSTVTGKINALDATVDGLTTSKTITVLTEANGIISATASDIAIGAGQVTSGTFADGRIPSLNASKINAGTFADARIPNLNASKITAGTLPIARGGTNNTSFTAKEIVYYDDTNGKLASAGTTKEKLNYLNNVTSDIQGQIDSISGGGTDHIRYYRNAITYVNGAASNINVSTTNIVGGKTVSVGDILIDTKGQMGTVSSISNNVAVLSWVATIKLTATLANKKLTISSTVAIT